MLRLDVVHRSEIAYELLEAGALVVGSATLNNNMLPRVADVMTYLKGLRPAHKLGQAFGSYGWSGEAMRQIEEVLSGMKVELAGEGIRVKNVPDETVLARCYDLGLGMAQKVNSRLSAGETENG